MKFRHLCLLAASAAAAGCATLEDVGAGIGLQPSAKDLQLPAVHGGCPDRSGKLKRLKDCAVAVDVSEFPERVAMTATGITGVPRIVGFVPLRALAEREAMVLVDRHFRFPVAEEIPLLTLRIVPDVSALNADGSSASARFSWRFSLVPSANGESPLFEKDVEASARHEWTKGIVPPCVDLALHNLFGRFLDACAADGSLAPAVERLSAQRDKTTTEIRRPKLLSLEFQTRKDGEKGSVSSGTCKVDCNGWEAFQTANWAKAQIAVQCVEHLGIEKERVRVRYDPDRTVYDPDTKTWTFAFATWARTRMVLQYDAATRRGAATVDLGLFEGTAEAAAVAAKEFVMREMNLRAAVYADDAEVAKADVAFGDIETDREADLLTLPFTLVY